MKILFIQDNIINESLILMELSAYLKMHGHQTFLLIDQEEKQLEKEIININPDIFIIPCYQFSLSWTLDVAKRIKTVSNKKIALAGVTPTLFPSIINNQNIDILFRAEAEEAIREVLDSLNNKEKIKTIKNTVVKYNGEIFINPLRKPENFLDEIPLPDRELYYNRYRILRNMGLKRFMSGRGCINKCSYCYNSSLKKIYNADNVGQNFIKRKSPERVIEEIKYVKMKYPLNHVHFSDDLFCVDDRWVESFSKNYKRNINVPFTCNAAVDLLNGKIIKKLKEANCRGIAIGIETGNENLRFKIMNKKITNAQIKEVAAIIKGHNLKLITFNIIANPYETLDNAIETIRLNQQIKSDCVRVLFACPIPHTNYARLGIQEGLFTEKDLFEFFTVADPKYADRIFFQTTHKESWFKLYYLFWILVKFPLFNPRIKKIISLPRSKFFNTIFEPLQFLNLLDERKVFGINYMNALRYYLRMGNPYKNRKNVYPSFI